MAKAAVQNTETPPKPPAVPPRAPVAKADEKKVPPAGFVLGPLPEGQAAGDVLVITPLLVGDVAPGFTPGAVPGAGSISAIKVDTAAYGTETPPRQYPPTNADHPQKHSPPSSHDANGAKIVSAAPTCSGIAPTTGTAGPGAAITVTLTGTNFDRATYAAIDGVIQSQSVYVSATSMTVTIDPKYYKAGVVQFTAVNSAGVSVQRVFTFS